MSHKYSQLKFDLQKAIMYKHWGFWQPSLSVCNWDQPCETKEDFQDYHILKAVSSKYATEVAKLPANSYKVVQLKNTEPPFENEYHTHNDIGTYHCVVCDSLLFKSKHKYDSGTGWPAFYKPAQVLNTNPDSSNNMLRTEISCPECNAHLGHVFDDGPKPTKLR